jgi:hypothetical protein
MGKPAPTRFKQLGLTARQDGNSKSATAQIRWSVPSTIETLQFME